VGGIFTYAKEKGWYSGENPAEHIRLPEMRRREKHSLVFETARSLLAVLTPPTRELAYSLIVLSCNVAELLGLTWKHINLSDQWGSVDGSALPPGRWPSGSSGAWGSTAQ
jgi:integrase